MEKLEVIRMELKINEKRVYLDNFFRWYPYLQTLHNYTIVEVKLNYTENAFILKLSNGKRLDISKRMMLSENYVLRYINAQCK